MKLRLTGIVSHRIMAGESLTVPKGKLWIVTYGPNASINGDFVSSQGTQLKLSGGAIIKPNNNYELYVFGLEFDYESNPIKIQKSKTVNLFLKQGEFFRIAKNQIFKGHAVVRDENKNSINGASKQIFISDMNLTKFYDDDGIISGVIFEIY